MGNAVLFDAVIEGAGAQAELAGGVFLNPQVFLQSVEIRLNTSGVVIIRCHIPESIKRKTLQRLRKF
jgi:hypothetical protein